MVLPDTVAARLLSFDEALERILASVGGPLPQELVPLTEARGRAAAVEIFAEENLPPFDNSAVDGFAIHEADYRRLVAEIPCSLQLGAEVRAGAASSVSLTSGIAFPIYTGAPVPSGTFAVVMLEDSERLDTYTILLRDPGSPRSIRRVGSDIAAGSLAVPKGTTIDAGVIGLLSALNFASVPCCRRPSVGIVTTGDEVIEAGTAPLHPGQIRDAVGPALAAAVEAAGGVVTARSHAGDSEAEVRGALEDCAACDIIISCGGVSVGAHDHVKAVADSMGTLDFWRIAIKPGKPLAFGQVGQSLFFGLPGNPVSSLVTFELFVRPILRKLAGHNQVLRRTVSAILDEPLPHEIGRREFVRARLSWENDTYRASITGPQGSHRLHSLLGADAYLIADEARGDYARGERLPAMLLF